MPSSQYRASGSWKPIALGYSRVSGSWKPCKQIWTKVGGTWKIVYDITIEDTFSGSGSITDTPGNVPWQVVKGSFSQSGGNAVAGTSSSVAGIETGINEGITVEIDNATSNTESGTGTSFWIQDQNNWWGTQIYYEFYSYPSTTPASYNWDCTYKTYNGNYVAAYNVYSNYYISGNNVWTFAANGRTRNVRYRTCNVPTRRYTTTTGLTRTECVGSCADNPAGSSGTFCNAPLTYYNCPGAFCFACSYPSYNYSSSPFAYNTPGAYYCPPSTCGYVGNFATCYATNCTYYLCATNYAPVAASCPSNVDAPSNWAFNRYNASNEYVKTANCSPGTEITCSPVVYNFTVPITAYATTRKSRVIKSSAGTVSTVTDGPDNGNAGVVGYLSTQMTTNQVLVTSYSGANKTGTQWPTITYNIPPGTTKSTRHGILVSGVPTTNLSPGTNTTQGYAISRFKVNIP